MASALDSFNRANGALAGSTCSDGINTWAVTGGAWAIVSNAVTWSHGAAADFVAYVDSLSAIATQYVSARVWGEDIGVVARWSNTGGLGTFYLAYVATMGGPVTLYKRVGGSFFSLGSGGTCATGDLLGLVCIDDAIAATVNGAVVVTATDAAITDGTAGLYAGGDSNIRTWDDFGFLESLAPDATLTPDGTVSNSGWTANGAGTLHGALATGDSDYASADTDGAVAVLSLSNPPGSIVLSGVTIRARARLN